MAKLRQSYTNEMIAGVIVIVIMLFAFSILRFLPYDPNASNFVEQFNAPSLQHPFGTDALGRDLLIRILYGGRLSLLIGTGAATIATGLGFITGLIVGIGNRVIRGGVLRSVDVMLSLPQVFLIVIFANLVKKAELLSSYYGTSTLLIVTIGITSWMTTTRLVGAICMTIRQRDYYLAALAIGATKLRLLRYYLIPSTIATVVVSFVIGIGASILLEAGISYVGFGIHPYTPTWGNLLVEAASSIGRAWWLTLFPALALILFVVAINLVADGLLKLLDMR